MHARTHRGWRPRNRSDGRWFGIREASTKLSGGGDHRLDADQTALGLHSAAMCRAAATPLQLSTLRLRQIRPPKTPYDLFMESEGVPVFSDIGVGKEPARRSSDENGGPLALGSAPALPISSSVQGTIMRSSHQR